MRTQPEAGEKEHLFLMKTRTAQVCQSYASFKPCITEAMVL